MYVELREIMSKIDCAVVCRLLYRHTTFVVDYTQTVANELICQNI